MESEHQWGTKSSIEAVGRIKKLVADLRHSVEVLDADIAAERKRPNLRDLRGLDMRRRNLMATIASLEDRLVSIEQLSPRGLSTTKVRDPVRNATGRLQARGVAPVRVLEDH